MADMQVDVDTGTEAGAAAARGDDAVYPTIDSSALNYAEWVWDVTLNEQKLKVLVTLALEIMLTLDGRVKDGDLTAQQVQAIKDWKAAHKTEVKDWKCSLEKLMEKGVEIVTAYQMRRAAIKRMVFHPTYTLDVTEPYLRLKIQRIYDTSRETVHIGEMSLDPKDMLRIKYSTLGRNYYRGSPLMTDDISAAAEVAHLVSLGPTANKIQSWLPEVIADLAGVRRDGRPMDEGSWLKTQSLMYYYRVDEIFPYPGPAAQLPPVAQGAAQAVPAPAPALPPPAAQAQQTPHQQTLNSNSNANSRHGRPAPYTPTLQTDGGKYANTRGNPPAGISSTEWEKLYNKMHSRVYDRLRKRVGEGTSTAAKMATKVAKNARDNGGVRDDAIDDLIARGKLPVGFVDTNP